MNWEGRVRPFEAALQADQMPAGTSDLRVLHMLADELGVDLGLPDVAAARAELARLGTWDGQRARAPAGDAGRAAAARPTGEAVLASWRHAARRRAAAGRRAAPGRHRGTPPVARLSAATAAEIGAADGELVTRHGTERGAITLPLSDHRRCPTGSLAAAELRRARRCTRAARACTRRRRRHDRPAPATEATAVSVSRRSETSRSSATTRGGWSSIKAVC